MTGLQILLMAGFGIFFGLFLLMFLLAVKFIWGVHKDMKQRRVEFDRLWNKNW